MLVLAVVVVLEEPDEASVTSLVVSPESSSVSSTGPDTYLRRRIAPRGQEPAAHFGHGAVVTSARTGRSPSAFLERPGRPDGIPGQ